jgi:hypothetical protein
VSMMKVFTIQLEFFFTASVRATGVAEETIADFGKRRDNVYKRTGWLNSFPVHD